MAAEKPKDSEESGKPLDAGEKPTASRKRTAKSKTATSVEMSATLSDEPESETVNETEPGESSKSEPGSVPVTLPDILKKWQVWAAAAVLVVGLALVVYFVAGAGLPGNSISGQDKDAAAIVNQTRIPESKVTANIMAIRASYSSDAQWADALVQSGNTPEKLRDMVIEQLIKEELLAQYAQENGLAVDTRLIDEQIVQAREGYQKDDEWLAYLHANGFNDEAGFREYLYTANLNYLVSESLEGTNKDLSDLLQELRAAATIEIKPMPQGLPYVVALPETSSSSAAKAPETSEVPAAVDEENPPAEPSATQENEAVTDGSDISENEKDSEQP